MNAVLFRGLVFYEFMLPWTFSGIFFHTLRIFLRKTLREKKIPPNAQIPAKGKLCRNCMPPSSLLFRSAPCAFHYQHPCHPEVCRPRPSLPRPAFWGDGWGRWPDVGSVLEWHRNLASLWARGVCTCVRCPAFLQGEPLPSDNEGSICERLIWSHVTAFNSPLASLVCLSFFLKLSPCRLPPGSATRSDHTELTRAKHLQRSGPNTVTEGCSCK